MVLWTMTLPTEQAALGASEGFRGRFGATAVLLQGQQQAEQQSFQQADLGVGLAERGNQGGYEVGGHRLGRPQGHYPRARGLRILQHLHMQHAVFKAVASLFARAIS